MGSFIVVFIIIVIILLACSSGKGKVANHTEHLSLEEGNSYLYYFDEDGKMRYEEECCRECVRMSAEDHRKKGHKVTEMHLGKKLSGDL